MAAIIRDFFEDTGEQWKYHEACSGLIPRFDVTMTQRGSATEVYLSDPAQNSLPFFITGFVATDDDLRITRVQMRNNNIQDVDPPLIVTQAPNERNHVDRLFTHGDLLNEAPPYDGTVVSKQLREVPLPGLPGTELEWRIAIESRGSRHRGAVLWFDFELRTGLGITSFSGTLIGTSFKYLRFFGLEPWSLPQTSPGEPAPVPPSPQQVRTGSRGQTGAGPFSDAASRRRKEIWDLEYYERRLKEDNEERKRKGLPPREPTPYEASAIERLNNLRASQSG